MNRWTLTRLLFYLWLGSMLGSSRTRRFVAGMIAEFFPEIELLIDKDVERARKRYVA